MTAAYPRAAIPEPYRILGLRLKPLCLGHYIHMERMELGFFREDGAEISLEDLLWGVLICSMSYEEFSESMQKPDFWKSATEWGRHCGVFNAKEKISLFQKYLVSGSKQPVVIFEQEGISSGAHWMNTLKVALVGLGNSPSEALNMPLSQAYYDFYKHAENKGAVTIASPEDAALMEQYETEVAHA